MDLQVGSDGSHSAYLIRFPPDWRSTVFHPWKLYFTANTGVNVSENGPRDIDIDNLPLDRITLYFSAREGDEVSFMATQHIDITGEAY